MSETIHIDDNQPFIVERGARIVVPSGAPNKFIKPRLRVGYNFLPCLACLQMVSGENGSPARYRFSSHTTSKGFKLFVPARLNAGDELIVIWREPRSAAAIHARLYPTYLALFDESEDRPGQYNENWD